MTKKFFKILFFTIFILLITLSSSFAYSDDLFEFDLPSNYANLAYQNMYVFSDSNDSDKGFIIYALEDQHIKKSVWDISRTDLQELVEKISSKSNIVDIEKRAKLGKEKAAKIILAEDGIYMEIYILASNKYVYMVAFMGNSEEDFDTSDYIMIKDSFKLKDSTTNFRMLYIVILILVFVISIYIKYRRFHR